MAQLKPQSILQNLRWLAGANFAVKPLWFVFLLVSTRALGPDEFGKFMYAFSYVAVFVYLFEGGIDMYTMRELSADPAKFKVFFGQTTMLKLISGLCFAIAVGISFFIVDLSREQMVLIVLAVVHMFFQSAMIHFRFIFRAFEVMQYEARSILLEKIGVVVLCGAAILMSNRAQLFMTGFVLAYALTSVSTFVMVWRRVGLPQWSYDPVALWTNVLKPAMPFALMGIFTIVYYRSSTLLLQQITGSDTMVGYYNAGYRLVEAFALLPTIIVVPLYATFARSSEDKTQVVRLLPLAVRILLAMSVAVSLPMILFHAEITGLLFGAAFLPASASVGLVVLTMVPVGMTWLFGNLAGAVKRQGHLNWFIVCITVGNLILNWLLIARHGVMGAAVTTLVSELAMAASAAWVVRDYVDLREFVKAFTGVFVPAGVVFVAGKLHVFPGAFPMQLSLTLLCLSAGFLVSGAVRIKDVRRFMNV